MKEKQRSLAQNRYRFGVVVATIMKYMNAELEREGCEYRLKPEDVDLFIKENALKIVHRISTSLGEFIITGKLRTRNTKDFEEAMTQIRAYFAEKGIDIPEPNEVDLSNYADEIGRM
jgi:hypothetical protein